MHSAGLLSPKDPAFSVSVGLAALILEGRPNQNNTNSTSNNNNNNHHYENDADATGAAEAFVVAEYARGRNIIKDAAQRFNQKLQQIRTCPGTSKDYIETSATIEVPIGSPSRTDDFAEKIYVNPNFRNEYAGGPHHIKGVPYGKPTRSLFKTVEAWTESNIIYNGLEKIKMLHSISPIKMNLAKNAVNAKKKAASQPNYGPHCEQFLKRIGLIKIDHADEADHKCEYISDMCRLWQTNLAKITAILMKNECICIEVYLGPEHHAILLEQWTIKTMDRATQPVMSLQSLCSAIRSQLYFSQVTAWSDQLKNLPVPLQRIVLDNPRILKNAQLTKARLDIHFRIRSFDGAHCFNVKPQIHQFPDAIVTDSLYVQVCLRNIPRSEAIPMLVEGGHIVASVPKPLTDDRKLTLCTEKGKHRCVCDEEESPTKEADLATMFPSPSMAHREKQLHKYRRRLMKREKGGRKKDSTTGTSGSEDEGPRTFRPCSPPAINSTQTPLYVTSNNKTTQTIVTVANNVANNTTVGTQTDFTPMDCGTSPQCDLCGNNMICLNCDTNTTNKTTMTRTNHQQQEQQQELTNGCDMKNVNGHKEATKSTTPTTTATAKEEKAEILLRAIERTASANELQAHCDTDINLNNNGVNGGIDCERNGCHYAPTPPPTPTVIVHESDCRLCKRQKTQHPTAAGIVAHNAHNSDDTGKALNGYGTTPTTASAKQANDKKPPSTLKPSTPTPTPLPVRFYINPTSDTGDEYNCELGQVCTIRKTGGGKQFTTPKVNLTRLFESSIAPNSDELPLHEKSISSPTIAEHVFTFDNLSPGCSSSPVQKSSSAPTFNNAISTLSPRFCRMAAAMYKRRSRHLSDRSSTSEEPLSDDELNFCDNWTMGRTSSAAANKSSTNKFARKPLFNVFNLLGSLEESLLQHRLPPKQQVAGFKVLLGASGSFCPTQLTVPATSYFYELESNNITTPYVSEIILPRKGYCVPRSGTIQVTLLNPLGTVVRMFVVPYDFSEMPSTSVTFIRQRVLARDDAGKACNDILSFNKLSSKDQMRLLRYAIHLRFKTSRSGRLYLHTDVKMLILRRPDCDTAAAHANNSILESPNELSTITMVPDNPRYSDRIEK